MSWHEKTSVVIVALAAAGALVTAYATVRSMLMQRRKQTERRPTIADLHKEKARNLELLIRLNLRWTRRTHRFGALWRCAPHQFGHL